MEGNLTCIMRQTEPPNALILKTSIFDKISGNCFPSALARERQVGIELNIKMSLYDVLELGQYVMINY